MSKIGFNHYNFCEGNREVNKYLSTVHIEKHDKTVMQTKWDGVGALV